MKLTPFNYSPLLSSLDLDWMSHTNFKSKFDLNFLYYYTLGCIEGFSLRQSSIVPFPQKEKTISYGVVRYPH